MNGPELRRAVDFIQREYAINEETIFSLIEKGIKLAIFKKFGEEEDVQVEIDRNNGTVTAVCKGEKLNPDDLGRIAAQATKQLLIQGIREEQSTTVLNQYKEQKGELVTGTVQRFDGGMALVSLGRTEALLPRSEQIPGESHHVNERVKAVILDVKKQGHRVKIILSRTHPDFVRRLFEGEIPEIQDRTIEIKAVAREAGYRSKVAVSSIDMKVDCVGACVGVRGSRIKNITEELGGERIDIVRWNDSLQVLIPNALQPATIEEVFLYQRLGRAVVLVKEDQLSLAIGRRGQNVRLASKLVGWDIEIMTHDELNESIDRAVTWFSDIPNIQAEQVEALIEEGFLSFDDLTFLETYEMAELLGTTEEEAEELIAWAEEMAETVEVAPTLARSEEAKAAQRAQPATPQERAAALFATPEEGAAVAEEPKPTAETLFRELPTEGEAQPEGEPAAVVAEGAGEEAQQVEGQPEPSAVVTPAGEGEPEAK